MLTEQQQQHVVVQRPERQEIPRHFLSICVCVKDERPFMREFVQHYLAQGADHIYIVDNGSSDGLEEEDWLVRDMPGSVALTAVTVLRDARDMRILTDNTGGHGHSRLLTENLFVRLRNQSEWAAVVDADEFMFGKNGHTLRSYLQSIHQSEINRVYVHWNIITPPVEEVGGEEEEFGKKKDQDGEEHHHHDGVPETFSLAQNRQRVNYDRDLGGGYARFAGAFGKSLFRPRATRLEEGLWLHKVAVAGLAVTNYRPTELDPQPHIDNGPPAPLSEAAYAALDVSMHHYALRHRADCAKKRRQLTTMDKKTPFVLGLFELLRRQQQENTSAGDGVAAASSSSSSWFVRDTHLPAAHTTMVVWAAAQLELVRFEGPGLLRLVGWAARLAGDGRAASVRFVPGGDDGGSMADEESGPVLLEPRDGLPPPPLSFPAATRWNQLVQVKNDADSNDYYVGRLQMRAPGTPWNFWATFLRVPRPEEK